MNFKELLKMGFLCTSCNVPKNNYKGRIYPLEVWLVIVYENKAETAKDIFSDLTEQTILDVIKLSGLTLKRV